MYKNLRWKLIITVAVTALAVWSFSPPGKKIRLGLDLKGGAHFVLAVQTDDALRLETETSSEQLRVALHDAKITTATAKVNSLTEFQIDGVPQASMAQLQTIADQQVATLFDRDQT